LMWYSINFVYLIAIGEHEFSFLSIHLTV
jgi:hypothetical protein